jgi:hypothetical protein
VHLQSRGTGFGDNLSVISIRTLTHEFRVLTDCPHAARTLAYVETRPQISIPSPVVTELQVERAHGFYRLGLPKGGMIEGSALHLLDALHRFIFALLEEETPGAPLIHAGSIRLEGVPMILIGAKSSGKTTLVLELIGKGHTAEGDEYVIVRESDLIARPRTLRVKASSLMLVPVLADRIRQTPSILDWKSCPIYAVSPAIAGTKWQISPMHPKHIIFLEANHGGHTVATPITTEEAFRRLLSRCLLPQTGRSGAVARLRRVVRETQAWEMSLGDLVGAQRHLLAISRLEKETADDYVVYPSSAN